MSNNKRTKRKAYFLSANPLKKRKADLVPGIKGFICTCNGNMKGCIKEALNILDDFESKLNPDTYKSTKFEKEGEDIEEVLKKELNHEREGEKKFRNIDTGINNCIFIGTTVDNIVEIADKIVREVKQTKIPISRHLIRLLPVEITRCNVLQPQQQRESKLQTVAFVDDIKKAANEIFDKHFKCDPVLFSIILTKRSNNNIDRLELIKELVLLIKDRNINHKVNLNSPIKSVIVEIIRNICCLSVVTNFNELMKFNLIALASNEKAVSKADKEETVVTLEEDSNVEPNEEVTSSTNSTNDKESLVGLGFNRETNMQA